jgi:hypothetical protein
LNLAVNKYVLLPPREERRPSAGPKRCGADKLVYLIRSSSQAASKKANGLTQGRKLSQNVMHREWICGMDGMLGGVISHMTPHV